MAVDVTTAILIGRPRAEVAAFAVDPDNTTKWYANITSVEWETPPPLTAGTKLRFVARFLGRTLSYTYEVRQWAPGELFVMSTAEGPFPMETTYAWKDAPGGGTEMTLRNRGNPSGFSNIMSPFMAMAMRRANRKDLALLKSVLESPNTSASA